MTGDTPLVVGGTTYTLRLSINAICDLEEDSGLSMEDLLQRASGGSMRTVRQIIHAALREHHPTLTPVDVGNLMTDAGLTAIRDTLAAAVTAAYPVKEQARSRRMRAVKN